ncbi:MAG: [protein-PII] uridylyltransferase [Planctomycetaceae bacterium]|nr:[protein-PII] uridylyltransferase [Planctomycetaceae bacterium]
MTSASAAPTPVELIRQRRQRIQRTRTELAERRAQGESGIQATEWLSDQMDALLIDLVRERQQQNSATSLQAFALLAVGGNGRRRPAPYSDIDLLFLIDPRVDPTVEQFAASVIRDLWDLRVQVGASVRTLSDSIQFACNDIQFATSLIATRHLIGNQTLTSELTRLVAQKVFPEKSKTMIERFEASRLEEWRARGNSVNQLEPDVKRSPGGLRDLHVLQWTAFVNYRTTDLQALCDHQEISADELAALHHADEYLTALRLDLHLNAELKQDVLTRELQLEITKKRRYQAPEGMRPVVAFMQEHFSYTSRVAEVARRVTEPSRRPGILSRLKHKLPLTRVPQHGMMILNGTVVVPEERLSDFVNNPNAIMDIFALAAERGATISPDLRQFIGEQAASLPAEPEHETCKRFRALLRQMAGLPDTLRAMYETGFLEWLVPPFAEIRCLIQFNQYHSFTVDEHTLKTIDEVVTFDQEDSPVGSAYRTVRHHATLHLSLLMHDVGKGREGDHSEIGALLCRDVGLRLQMAENKKTMMEFLVRQHLVMPNLAFRRDTSDSAVLVGFARLVGSPELLRMLYVLTVADIRAVGPDVWSDWKGELLADLYDRSMQILSGRPFNHLERERLQMVRQAVQKAVVPVADSSASHLDLPHWIDDQCQALPPFYLMTEQPDRIARDLGIIQQLGTDEVRFEGLFDPETETVTYRLFASPRYEAGSFHKITGILSGMRMNILAGQTCTTANGILIASFRVTDSDFSGRVPAERINEVGAALQKVLTGQLPVDSVFRRSALYRMKQKNAHLDIPEPQVTIDNDCSKQYTVIDVFAVDTEGLLYTLARTLFEEQLQIQLARIATHVEEVVDVFYVLDANGQKILDPETLRHVQESLLQQIRELNGKD